MLALPGRAKTLLHPGTTELKAAPSTTFRLRASATRRRRGTPKNGAGFDVRLPLSGARTRNGAAAGCSRAGTVAGEQLTNRTLGVRCPLRAQHNFAAGVPLFQGAIGLPDLVKREHPGNGKLQFAGRDEIR
jgi:hypothetical protein